MKKLFFLLLFLPAVVISQTITDTTTLRTRVNADIVPNSNRSITAQQVQNIFNGILNTRNILAKYSDTAAMLSPYVRTANAYNGATAVKYSDTAAMLLPYTRTSNANYLSRVRSDTMLGDLNLTRSATPAYGQISFGNTGDKYFYNDGSTFNLSGYPLNLNANLSLSSGGYSGIRALSTFKNNLNFNIGGIYQNSGGSGLLKLSASDGTDRVYRSASEVSFDSTGYPLLINRKTVVGAYTAPLQVRGIILSDSLVLNGAPLNAFVKAGGGYDNTLYAPLSGANTFTGVNNFNNAVQFNSTAYFASSPYITAGSLNITDVSALQGAIIMSTPTLQKTIRGSLSSSLLYADTGRMLVFDRYSRITGASSRAGFTHDNTADRVYAFPDKSGTVAFTSDLTAGYVPYTGANAHVNLGTFNLTARNFFGSANAAGNSYVYRGFKTDGLTQIFNLGQTGNNDGYLDLWSSGGSQNFILQAQGNSYDSSGYPFLFNTKTVLPIANPNSFLQVAGSVNIRDSLTATYVSQVGTNQFQKYVGNNAGNENYST